MTLYDRIGAGYAQRRRPDPRIREPLHAALAGCATVVNVGAGAGSYEPEDRPVVAIEPSVVMAGQRPSHLPPAVIARAEELPLADGSADAALAVLTIHHWADKGKGLAEMLRVARRRVVLLTVDTEVASRMWLMAEYLPEAVEQDRRDFPAIAELLRRLGPSAVSTPVAIPRDCSDRFLLTYWGRPEELLDPDARAATSACARLDDRTEERFAQRLRADLESGAWDERHGGLREREELDAGLRLVVADVG